MKFARTLFTISTLSVAAHSFANPASVACQDYWTNVEKYKADGEITAALLELNLFSNDNCFDSSDIAKRRVISQIRAENYLVNLEKFATNLKADYKPTGGHAHTTAECAMRDYQRNIDSLKNIFANHTSSPLFEDLESDDIDGFNQRLTVVADKFENIKSDIQTQCINPVAQSLASFDESNPKFHPSVEKPIIKIIEVVKDSARADEKNTFSKKVDALIAGIRANMRNSLENGKKGQLLCDDLRSTDPICSGVAGIKIQNEYLEQIKLLQKL
jgi:hypothetical protein